VAEVLQQFEALRFALAGAWEPHFAVELVVAEARRFQLAVRDLLETLHSMHSWLEPSLLCLLSPKEAFL